MRDALQPPAEPTRRRRRSSENPSLFAEIYIMKADGTGQRRLTTEWGYDGGPFFTHDGTRIVWRHFDDTGLLADIWTMKPDGTDKKQITDVRLHELVAVRASRQASTSSSRPTSSASRTSSCSSWTRPGQKEPVRVTYTDGFDSLPVLLAGWHAARPGPRPALAAARDRSSWPSGITRKRWRC